MKKLEKFSTSKLRATKTSWTLVTRKVPQDYLDKIGDGYGLEQLEKW